MTLSQAIYQHRIQLLVTLLLTAGLYSSVIPDMVREWYRDDNYSHGFLVPFIAGYFIFRFRGELKELESAPSPLGLPVIVLALLQFTMASLCTEFYTLRLSLVLLLAGLVLFLFGAPLFRKVWAPIAFLVFMVPLPQLFYNAISLPLKLFVTRVSVAFLQLVGVTAVREGNIIMLPNSTLEVAGACSGVRSLLTLLTLSTAYAFLLQVSPLKRVLIIVFAIPLAIVMNMARVIETGIMVQKWGVAMAQGLYHELAGIVLFMLAILLLVAFGRLLSGSGRW